METSASDMLALANNIRDNDGFNGNNSWLWIIILFFLIGGNGWNNRGDYATKANLYESANAQNTFSEFRSLQNETTRGFSDVNQHLCNGFANINQNISGNFANTNMGIAKGFYDETMAMNCGFNGIGRTLQDMSAQMASCCCDIKGIVHDEGEKTRALITANTIQELRDQVAAKDRELLATGLTTAQVIQTNTLEEYLRKVINNNGCCGY